MTEIVECFLCGKDISVDSCHYLGELGFICESCDAYLRVYAAMERRAECEMCTDFVDKDELTTYKDGENELSVCNGCAEYAAYIASPGDTMTNPYDTYQEQALKTAMFDNLPNGFPPMAYCALALGGETGELLEKLTLLRTHVTANTFETIREAGDVLWYLAALAHVSGYQLSTVFADEGTTRKLLDATDIPVRVGRVQELVKKIYRDDYGVPTPERRDALLGAMRDVGRALVDTCGRHAITLQDVMDANIAKLRDRRSRGVLQGSGDNR